MTVSNNGTELRALEFILALQRSPAVTWASRPLNPCLSRGSSNVYVKGGYTDTAMFEVLVVTYSVFILSFFLTG